MQRLLQPYLIAVEKYPFVTKCLTSGVLVGSGDVISQTIIEKAKNPEKKVSTMAIILEFLLHESLRFD
jgi:hypothetical protein